RRQGRHRAAARQPSRLANPSPIGAMGERPARRPPAGPAEPRDESHLERDGRPVLAGPRGADVRAALGRIRNGFLALTVLRPARPRPRPRPARLRPRPRPAHGGGAASATPIGRRWTLPYTSPAMVLGFLNRFVDSNDRELRRIQPLVDRINELEPEFEALSDDEIRARMADIRAE